VCIITSERLIVDQLKDDLHYHAQIIERFVEFVCSKDLNKIPEADAYIVDDADDSLKA
jgi:hypothetical protein